MLLTSEQAMLVAHSQKDLGGKTKNKMALVLSDESDKSEPFEPITELITVTIMEAEDLDMAIEVLGYSINALNQAVSALKSINK